VKPPAANLANRRRLVEACIAKERRATTESPAPRGFTLFEVLVALALSTLVLTIIGMAIDFHLRVVEAGRSRVEEAQLARAILHRMADDIRTALCYDPMDIQNLATTAIGGQADRAMDLFGEDVPAEDADALEDAAASLGDDLTEEEESSTMPGLYGESNWLQVDVSRPLRLEEFSALFDNELQMEYTGPVGDIRSIVYYLAGSESAPVQSSNQIEESVGLMRMEVDRAVADFAAKQGFFDETQTESESIAPEVTDLVFQYYDGYEWVDYWDSEERGGLPVAVMIAMMVDPTQSKATQESGWQVSTDSGESGTIEPLEFRLVVDLPAAEPSDSSQSGDMLGDEFGDSSESSSGGSGSSSSSGGPSPSGGGQTPGGSGPPAPSGGGTGR
jgi:prepilin-type N-terminal cleavage/methylation domain-containing protein